MLKLEDIFDTHLPELVSRYVHRSEQVSLAENISSVIEAGENGVFEAGTGIGKTLSYLVPALMSDKTVIISTGTRNLQDQLYRKDLPMLAPLFPAKRVSILKGRANYLCVHRMKSNLKVARDDLRALEQLVEIRSWSSRTRTGDLTELLDPEESPALINMVTSTRDNCLGSRCPEFHGCPLYRAREAANQSDLIVVNHHLLFADLVQREDALQSLLPKAGAVIVDEAHRVPDIVRQFSGQQVSSGQIHELIKDSRMELALLGNDDPTTLDATKLLEKKLNRLRELILASQEQDFGRWYRSESQRAIRDVDLALGDLAEHLQRVSDRSEGLAQALRRTLRFSDQFALLTEETDLDGDYVHWIERRDRGFVIHLSPLSVAKDMNDLTRAVETSWVFTSATLCVDDSFDLFVGEMGLASDISAIFHSPFDYQNAVRAYLPSGLPEPGEDAHTEALVREIQPLISENPGRTFFLFTSHRALKLANELLKDSPNPIFAQGTMSKARLVEAFMATPGSVLLATQSFWEGVDVRGADLKLLIIDKLPFPNPSEPLFEAQSRDLEEKGGNSFADLSLPRTVLALKQGFGRLIRQESDCGLFVIGDGRLRTRSYRKYVTGNLPEMKWLDQRKDAIDWLREL